MYIYIYICIHIYQYTICRPASPGGPSFDLHDHTNLSNRGWWGWGGSVCSLLILTSSSFPTIYQTSFLIQSKLSNTTYSDYQGFQKYIVML